MNKTVDTLPTNSRSDNNISTRSYVGTNRLHKAATLTTASSAICCANSPQLSLQGCIWKFSKRRLHHGSCGARNTWHRRRPSSGKRSSMRSSCRIPSGSITAGSRCRPLQRGAILDEAPLFWSRARREHLNRLSPEELAAECRKMLEIQAERVALLNDIVSQVRSDASRRMAALVRSRYSYKPSLIEVARYFRQQKISLKRASTLLAEKPLECIDGSLVTFRDDRFIVRPRDQVLGAVTEGQFRRVYWSLGKIPPTP
jgi:hypothetical protein